jgi:hypothetical protein
MTELRPFCCLVVLGLWCSPAVAGEPPVVELGASDQALTAMLAAACPISQTIDSAAAGLPGMAKIAVELTEPSVRVTNAAVKVTMRYHAKDASGLVDLSGVAKPDLRFVVIPGKGIVEARLVRLVIALPGGVEVPLDTSLAPFALPAIWSTPIDLNGKPVVAQVTVTEVVPEAGRAVLRGEIAFKPRKGEAQR